MNNPKKYQRKSGPRRQWPPDLPRHTGSNIVYLACKAFYQALPKQLRARGMRERDIRLPKWFTPKDDSDNAKVREELRAIASQLARKP